MRRCICSILLLTTVIGNAQLLTIGDLLYLNSKTDYGSHDSLLKKKGFQQTGSRSYNNGNITTITYYAGKKGNPGFGKVMVYIEPTGISVEATCGAVDSAQVFRQIKNSGFHLRDAYACGADAQLRTYAGYITGNVCIYIHIHADLLYPSQVYCSYSVGSEKIK
jgi:hypothetical protein